MRGVNDTFSVKVGEFEGPFDLLLTLIEERKMHISDVSLASIAEDFISFVRAQTAFPAEVAAGFILTASTLLLLKSKALLPTLTLTNDEEGDIKDLEHRLNLYAVFRDVARRLGGMRGRLYFVGLRKDATPLFSPAPDMTVPALQSALLDVLKQAPAPQVMKETTVQAVVSLEEMMHRLGERIERAFATTFREFVGSPEDRREIVVGFLAVLELVKRGVLTADQQNRFEDIRLEYAGSAKPPRYD